MVGVICTRRSFCRVADAVAYADIVVPMVVRWQATVVMWLLAEATGGTTVRHTKARLLFKVDRECDTAQEICWHCFV